jgi:hypothetical protein
VLWSVVVVTLVARAVASAIVLQDPDHYVVKQTWIGADLGLHGHLGGIVFSADGEKLYVVTNADLPTSAVYSLPVTRVGGAVTELGPATVVFTGSVPGDGLDAGLEFGPGGTLFYTYYHVRYLAQRPGGITGAETTRDLSSPQVRSSVSGLTFAPVRIDPGTSFGRLQIGTGFGREILEVPLTAGSDGVLEPGTATRFVQLPLAGVAGFQYVPAGTYAGNLLYANFDEGQLRLLMIDHDTGLPIDRITGLPLLATDDPREGLFASEFGVGPLGLEIDAQTEDDLFVTTFAGDPADSIVQIGGLTATFTTTTTTGEETTTSSSTTTVTTASTVPPTTLETSSSTTTATTAPASTSTVSTTSSTTSLATVSSTTETTASTTVSTSTTASATTTTSTIVTGTTATDTTTTATTVTATTDTSSTTTADSSSTSLPGSTTTTTTTPASSTSTTSATGTTTTQSSSTTAITSTTMPEIVGCPSEPTFASIACRLDRLGDQVRAAVARAPFQARLLRRVQRGRIQSTHAATQLTTGSRRSARASLRRARRALVRFRATLRSQTGRHVVPTGERQALRRDARSIARDLRQLRRGLAGS